MNVLHIGEYVQGGVATYIKTLISQEGKNNINNYLFMSEEKSEHEWNIPGDRVSYYHYQRKITSIFSAMCAIHKKINELCPDIIYCHSTWAGVLTRFPLLFIPCRAKVIYNAHGWAFLRDTAKWKLDIYAYIEKILSLKTDKIINVSKYEYDGALHYGIAREKMIIIYSGISGKILPIKEEINLSADCVNLLFVGRLDPQKGIDILLKAINRCKRGDIHLYVIGDKVLSDRSGIVKEDTDKVTFLGWMPHEEVATWYEACDAVVMPSRWEAFGLVAIEAMKYKKAVICSNRGALTEIVSDRKTGIVFLLDENGVNLGEVLMHINKNNLVEYGENGAKIFFHKYTDENMNTRTIKQYIEIYDYL